MGLIEINLQELSSPLTDFDVILTWSFYRGDI
jgi:hypothetical protein